MKYEQINTRVKGNGYSYNLNTKIDAIKLADTLNGYENKIKQLQEIITIEKQLKILTMDLTIVKNDLDHIKTRLEQLK